MNGIDKITQRISEEAQKEIDRVLYDARAEAERVSERYRSQGYSEAQELAERNEKNAAEQEARLISAAQMEARKVILATKQEMVEKAYALALEKLCALPEEEYIDVLVKLISSASSSGREQVILSPDDRKKIGKKVVDQVNADGSRKLTLSRQTQDIRGGFILKDKNVEVNCAFETLVRLQKAQTAGTVVKKLFP